MTDERAARYSRARVLSTRPREGTQDGYGGGEQDRLLRPASAHAHRAFADASEVEAQGEYTLIDRPHRLVMTWTFDDNPSNEQLIELSFSKSEGSTAVLMVNSAISTDERRDAQDERWHGCLDELERVLAG